MRRIVITIDAPDDAIAQELVDTINATYEHTDYVKATVETLPLTYVNDDATLLVTLYGATAHVVERPFSARTWGPPIITRQE